ncbi:MAG: hypothetical protein EPN60_06530 [Nevskiaceae bacterium]|nr:MAG: hypothetical protein EPO48_05465 [Nevskiaceae bacterium]TAM29003.1 MAG: hypothetical protein EPN60_06530 [Nevskiaceae bacterium]
MAAERGYVEASARARQIFFLKLACWGVLIVLVNNLHYEPVAEESLSARAERMLVEANYLLVGGCGFAAVLLLWPLKALARAARDQRWPPVGVEVPFRTRIRAFRRIHFGVACVTLVAAYIAFVALQVQVWRNTRQLGQLILQFDGADSVPGDQLSRDKQ